MFGKTLGLASLRNYFSTLLGMLERLKDNKSIKNLKVHSKYFTQIANSMSLEKGKNNNWRHSCHRTLLQKKAELETSVQKLYSVFVFSYLF